MCKVSCLAYLRNSMDVNLAENEYTCVIDVVKSGIVGAEQITVRVRLSHFILEYYRSLYTDI